MGAGRVPLCGLNAASPLPGSAVLNPVAEIAEAEIRICFREAKYAAIAHSAGPGLSWSFLGLSKPILAAKSIDFPCILLYFAA